MQLHGKKILFFSPKFFGYEVAIKKKMEEMGAEVDFYDERCITSAFQKALLKVWPSLFRKKSNAYYDRILMEKKDIKYDYIFFIKCDMVSKSVMKKITEMFPNAKRYLYLWDSIKNSKKIEDILNDFDKVYSFDKQDCEDNKNIFFRPLFYADDYKKQNTSETTCLYDICFIGTIHSDRYKIIKKIDKYCADNGLRTYWYLFLQSKFMYYFYKVTKKEFRKASKDEFRFEKISAEEIANVVKNTNVVLDVEAPTQTGLTMRTIEMVGMKKKLITTNNNITAYDIYKPENILCIDRKNPVIEKQFFSEEYSELNEEIFERYSIENWILEILDEAKA